MNAETVKVKKIYEKISNIRNPIFVLENKSAIDVLIHHEDYGDIMFTAAAYDTEEHGRLLWQELMNGVHGTVADFNQELFNTRMQDFRIYMNTEKYNYLLHMAADSLSPYISKRSLAERGLCDNLTELELRELTELEMFSAKLIDVRSQLVNDAVEWPTLPSVMQNAGKNHVSND